VYFTIIKIRNLQLMINPVIQLFYFKYVVFAYDLSPNSST